MERLADAGFRWRGASLVGQVSSGWVCETAMIGYGIGSRSDDLQPRNKKKKKTREQEDQLGEGEETVRAERVSFVLSRERKGKEG